MHRARAPCCMSLVLSCWRLVLNCTGFEMHEEYVFKLCQPVQNSICLQTTTRDCTQCSHASINCIPMKLTRRLECKQARARSLSAPRGQRMWGWCSSSQSVTSWATLSLM